MKSIRSFSRRKQKLKKKVYGKNNICANFTMIFAKLTVDSSFILRFIEMYSVFNVRNNLSQLEKRVNDSGENQQHEEIKNV